jgi:hypothetical protein
VDEESVSDEDARRALKPKTNIFVVHRAWWVDVEGNGLLCNDGFDREEE